MKGTSTLPGWPLMLRRDLATSYLGMSPSLFDSEAKAGRLPKSVPLTLGVRAWHRADLEAWAEDRRAVADGETNEWDAA